MSATSEPGDALSLFSPATAEWFRGELGEPTAAQEGAWRAIARGDDALVVAPTGSGKTLAAFLSAIDRLMFPAPYSHPRSGDPENSETAGEPENRNATDKPGDRDARAVRGTTVLYISPLKALGVDVERNLETPLTGVAALADRDGLAHDSPRVGVRTGDTPPSERRRLISRPPDILITTPESLFLMLTSRARETLRTVRTVIVDEVHAVAGTKRGVHLALSLARLDTLLEAPAQRIGLSATVEPVDEVAAYLAGVGRGRDITIVRPPSAKRWDVSVSLPVPDLSAISPPADALDEDEVAGTIWPHIERAVLAEVEAHRSTLVFTNSRRQAERLTGKLNRLHAQRIAATDPTDDAPTDEAHVDGDDSPVGDIARAHHGSMSKEHRTQIEQQLKRGALRCVVATSSLELGIDMGSVDLVIQVESPFSVSSALQRIGRAGHDVGATSTGIVHPVHAADVVRAAVTVRESLAGRIEPLAVPRNALDVLAQHTVSAAAMETLDLDAWFDTVRSAQPYATLPWSAFEATIDLLAGRYPSTAFSELRPRIIRDREANTITGRPGAQRLAVTSGGTIPDRGLYPVFIVAGDDETAPRRVGELDEEMVYESRLGDVIALGTSSWRIEEITANRVSVSPAFGLTGRIPFWHGDGVGRPPELGRAIASFQAEIAQLTDPVAERELTALGLDANARGALVSYLREQRDSVGVVPGPDLIVVERFLDELGDWRVIAHCALGQRITGPWALAVGARVLERYGLDAQVMAADDGIVLRIPHGEQPPSADLFVFSPEKIDSDVRQLVGSSALFAARFRECAARALLLPRRDPGLRSPLWQQRQRSASLLDVARAYPDFPIMIEAARECLQDVYDLPALVNLMCGIDERRIQVREVETPAPSPFARTLLFGYIAEHLYDSDAPLAERRTAALALDQSLLGELLGTTSLRDLLDAAVIAQVAARMQGIGVEHPARGPEGVADLLRGLGPLTVEQVADRIDAREPNYGGAGAPTGAPAGELARDSAAREAVETLLESGRAIEVRIAGAVHVAAVEDAALLRDALGVELPAGIPDDLLEPVRRPVEQLLSRWARTRGPFTLTDATGAFGLAPGVARDALAALVDQRRLLEGEYTPGREGTEWVDAEVLRRIRRASLEVSRRDIAPVSHATYARFLAEWQGIRALDPEVSGHSGSRGAASSVHAASPVRAPQVVADDLLGAVDQLAGVSLPLSAWESQILPARIADYHGALLDELFAQSELVWTGHGRLGTSDGWVRLHLADALALGIDAEQLASAAAQLEPGGIPARILELLRSSPGALRHGEILTALADQGDAVDPPRVHEALWDLAFSTLITNDSFHALRGYTHGPSQRSSVGRRGAPRSRALSRRGAARLSAAMLQSTGGAGSPGSPAGSHGVPVGSYVGASPSTGAGRWSAVRVPPIDPTARTAALAALLLDRHGVLTRGGMNIEDIPGSFAGVYRVLATLEENGHAQRGYFVDGLGASQFAAAEAVDSLRSFAARTRDAAASPSYFALAATDPANPYGAALPWPEPPVGPDRTARAARRAGALVLLRDGSPAVFVDRGGKSILWWSEPADDPYTAEALARAVARSGRLDKLQIERINGHSISAQSVQHITAALIDTGCHRSPRALRLRSGDPLPTAR